MYTTLKYLLSPFLLLSFVGTSRAQNQIINYTGATNGAAFGQSVAVIGDVDGDGIDDIVVGCPSSNAGGANAGAVEVMSGGYMSLLRVIDGDSTGEQFGYSVAGVGDLDGDGVPDFAVGAPMATINNNAKTGYVKLYSGKSLGSFKYIQGAAAGDEFGFSIAPAGGLNFIVGAPYRTNAGGSGAGSAYLYNSAATQLFEYMGVQAGQHFGWSLAGGYKTTNSFFDVLVGSPHYNGLFTDTGRIDVYSTSAAHTLVSTRNGVNASEMLGYSVAFVADITGDGFADYIAGAPGYNSSTGRAIVCNGKTGASIYNHVGVAAGDDFGLAVSIFKSPSLFGQSAYAVGAPYGNSGAGYVQTFAANGTIRGTISGAAGDSLGRSLAGAAHIDPTWSGLLVGRPTAIFTYNGEQTGIVDTWIDNNSGLNKLGESVGVVSGECLGTSVKMIADIDGDGTPDYVVGAPYATHSYFFLGILFYDDFAGRVNVYSGKTGSLISSTYGTAFGDNYGFSVSTAGDVNGDGRVDIVVGAPQLGNGVPSAGTIKVLSGLNFSTLFTQSGVQVSDNLGYAVDGGDDLNNDGHGDVVAGAPNSNIYGNGAGYVAAYSGFTGVKLFTSTVSAANSYFGKSVAMAHTDWTGDGKRDVMVGCPGKNSGQGAAYIVSGSNGSIWTTLAVGTLNNDFAGSSVASGGDMDLDGYVDALVGANGENNINGTDAGGVYAISGHTGATLHHYMGQAWSQTGTAVASVGDVNQDGRPDYAVGAPMDANLQNFGYGYVDVVSGVNGTPIFHITEGYYQSELGHSVSGGLDLDQDGIPDLIVGAPSASWTGTPYGRGVAFVYSLMPKGVQYYGTGTNGCNGPGILHTSGAPEIGNAYFGFSQTKPPGYALGLLLITDSPNYSGSDEFGIGLRMLIDFNAATEVYNFDMYSDGSGYGFVTTPVPNNPALVGNKYYAQALWLESSCILGNGNIYNLSSSSAAELTVQP
ncbi:MAG: FG-GAP repeat protein [Planctomycetes bacterium]|nr:FG-GAP repeat protein [Planctomycetota bacterium]